jgi:CP family cyanate transporter-like MFS transporter
LKRVHFLWALATVFLVSTVIRPPVAQIGPILDLIQGSLGITNFETAVLAAIPVLCFGIGAFASPALVRRFGVEKTLSIVLAVLLIALAVRPYLGFIGMLVGTMAAGLSIAVANVVLPTLVRLRFPNRVALLTSAYTTVLAASASFAAAFSYPSAIEYGWQFALAIWALPTVLAFLLSISLVADSQKAESQSKRKSSRDFKTISRSPIAWAIVWFFGIQSMGFYALLAWLPSIAIDAGLSPVEAGSLLSLMTFVGVPFGLLLSANYGRFKSLAAIGAAISMLTGLGLLLLFFGQWTLAAIVIGFGQASSFPLVLSLISTRSANQNLTTMLSSMAQGVGYLVAAVGTYLFGLGETLTGSWNLSIAAMLVLTMIQAFAAWFAGKPRVIKNPTE